MENKSIYTDWEQTSINERIKYIVDTFFKGNTTKMAKSVFVSQSTLRDIVGERNSAPSFETMKQAAFAASSVPVFLLCPAYVGYACRRAGHTGEDHPDGPGARQEVGNRQVYQLQYEKSGRCEQEGDRLLV